MNKIRILILSVFFVAILCSGCELDQTYGENHSDCSPEYIFTYAENHPDQYPTSKAAKKFAELVEERTDGRIRIQVICNAEFGTQQQIINQMKFGGVDFARVSISALADEVPILNVLQMPYIYEDSNHMWRVLSGEIGEKMFVSVSEMGVVPLSWYDAGSRGYYSTEKIDSLDDFKGKIIRVQESQMMRDMVTLLGGNAVDVAYTEVYSAFETGAIDGAENSWTAYYTTSHYKIARYYLLDEHTRVPEIQMISAETWNLLSEEDQQIIQSCAEISAQYEQELWEEQESIARKNALNSGCQEVSLEESELEKMKDCMAPLYEQYCMEYMDIIHEIMKEGER